MGRHSAPDDPDDDVELGAAGTAGGSAVALATGPGGRHTRHDEDGPAEGLALIDDALRDPAAGDGVESPAADPPRGPMVVVDAETAEAVVLEPIDEPLAPPPGPETHPGPAAASADPESRPRPTRGGAHATRHDLALIKAHGDVRARAIAAVLVPFVVFVAVLAVIGHLEVHYLVWIWAPAIAAGVLVGLVLDAGHRRHRAPDGAPAPVTAPADPA